MGVISRITICSTWLILMGFCTWQSFLGPDSSAQATPPSCSYAAPDSITNTPVPAQTTMGQVLINELLISPAHSWDCNKPTERRPWIELYNPQNQVLDLYAAHAEIDVMPVSYAYPLPLGSTIAAHGFLVFFLGGYNFTNATFNLSLNGTLVDQIAPVPLAPDQSYARSQDGGPSWEISSEPTIAASNAIILPTPTVRPTSAPTQSHHATPTPRSKTTGSSPGKQATRVEPPATGTQPAWERLQMPDATMLATDPPDSQLATTPFNTPPNSEDGMKKKWLITGTAILLVSALLWYSRRFFTKNSERKPPPSQSR